MPLFFRWQLKFFATRKSPENVDSQGFFFVRMAGLEKTLKFSSQPGMT
jgi:hypothetical protein